MKVGDKAQLKPTFCNNRNKNIEEVQITKIGRKYIETSNGSKFEGNKLYGIMQ